MDFRKLISDGFANVLKVLVKALFISGLIVEPAGSKAFVARV
jgi:hypothetical protein